MSCDPAAAEASLVPVTQLVKKTTVASLPSRPRLLRHFPNFCGAAVGANTHRSPSADTRPLAMHSAVSAATLLVNIRLAAGCKAMHSDVQVCAA